ncbi:MAG: DUF4280 domain-containing protein [Halanaerobiaceae bacterium]
MGDYSELYVCSGAELKCSFGDDTSNLKLVEPHQTTVAGELIATIMDNKPMVNIQPFGKCSSMANPTVAAATAANHGNLKKMPCTPVIPAPWKKGNNNVKVKGKPAVMESSTLNCVYNGLIEVNDPGQEILKG